MGNDPTIVLTNMEDQLTASEKEAANFHAALLVIGGELNGKIYDLPPGRTIVGRSTENKISLEFPGISRKHFQISINESPEKEKKSIAIIKDLGSRNGTFLNNEKLEGHVELKKGDIIKLGNIALKFIPKGDPERLTIERLNIEANTDGLTRCYNKAFFNQASEQEVDKCKQTGRPLSLILFDIDFFKRLNDNYGHDAGDFVLKELAGLVHTYLADLQALFSRYGGEEFTILLPDTSLKVAYDICEEIRNKVEQYHFMYDGQKLPVTISVGVADYRPGVASGLDLFKRVDIALYKSKDGGRNQVNFYRD
jgi:two-component system cell cycle response regulator